MHSHEAAHSVIEIAKTDCRTTTTTPRTLWKLNHDRLSATTCLDRESPLKGRLLVCCRQDSKIYKNMSSRAGIHMRRASLRDRQTETERVKWVKWACKCSTGGEGGNGERVDLQCTLFSGRQRQVQVQLRVQRAYACRSLARFLNKLLPRGVIYATIKINDNNNDNIDIDILLLL